MMPEYADPKRQQAHTLFVLRGYQPGDICATVDISADVLQEWAEKDDWIKRRQGHLEVMRDTAAAEMGLAVATQAGSIVSKYLGLQNKLLDKIDGALDNAATPAQINTLSKALSSNYSVYGDLLSSTKITDKSELPGSLAPPATMVQINVLNSLSKAVRDARVIPDEEDML